MHSKRWPILPSPRPAPGGSMSRARPVPRQRKRSTAGTSCGTKCGNRLPPHRLPGALHGPRRDMSREITVCPACDSRNILFFARRDNYVFSKCGQCALIFINPPPDPATLISDFYSASSGYHATLPEHLDAMTMHTRKFQNILDRLTNAGVNGKLLDVGCSHGE